MKDIMKNRLPISQAKNSVLEYLASQTGLEIAQNGADGFPIIEKAHYKYYNGLHVLLLVRTSRFINELKDGASISGMFLEKDTGFKTAKRFYGKFKCKAMALDDEILLEIAKEDAMYKKMIHHGAKFFTLELVEGVVQLGGDTLYTVDSNYDLTFAKYGLNGVERFENSRKILMEYQDREVIFNVFIEGNTYYTLTNANSNKVSYIKDGGVCKFYDGIENHFESKVEILPAEKVSEVFEKLKSTNNAFFKDIKDLIALAFENK